MDTESDSKPDTMKKSRDQDSFWSWLRQLRVRTLILILIPCLIVIPVIVMWLMPVVAISNRDTIDSADTARRVLGLIDFDHLSGPEIKRRIEELLRIKDSVRTELRGLEQKRAAMLEEIQTLNSRIEKSRMEESRQNIELERLKVTIEQVKIQQKEFIQRNTPDIAPPLPLLASRPQTETQLGHSHGDCTNMEHCWDYSRCSVSSRLPVFFYKSQSGFSDSVTQSPYIDTDPAHACLYISLDPETAVSLQTLPYWNGDGRNHLVLLSQQPADKIFFKSNAIIANSMATRDAFRPNFDIVIPPLTNGDYTWDKLQPLVPVVREYLLEFEAHRETSSLSYEEAAKQERRVVATLQDMKLKGTTDKFMLSFSCDKVDETIMSVDAGDWSLCGDRESRLRRLTQSTFCLVLPPSQQNVMSSPMIQTRIQECLISASIPVILSTEIILPFSEVIDWRSASVILPIQRVTELHFLLRTFSHADIFSLKRQGRLIMETYFSSSEKIVDTILDLLRHRLSIPGLTFTDTASPSVFNSSFKPQLMDHLPPEAEPDESLGPLESPYPSPSFKRNYSMILTQGRSSWNSWFSSHLQPPHTPWEPLLPSEAKYHGSGVGFRPINGGEGGTGNEFSQALGGNRPTEQFTVVMLTYEREHVLMDSLSRLYGLPYLNKVIVVWNSPRPPPSDLQWPDIGVEILVIKTVANSLNNRFLPFDAIETEAVLSVDDDAHLRHDEIIFGFRVWRENRDRLVGFPGRFHAWDLEHGGWNYNSNYSCELSMVLTGAAFYHKYYSYIYTHVMPEIIRDTVDTFMNCEDLALNFLISHITRKPPVKVTSRWTFRCPGCPSTLSEDDSHFQERHKCMNLFTQVYGYMPLLYTQFRADSVLFKTRIPAEKQKCFKFI